MKITIGGVDRSSLYQQSELEQISLRLLADRGDFGQGTFPVPDPDGTQEQYAGQSVLLEVGATVLFEGYLGSIRRDRSGAASGDRLVHTYNILDQNAGLNGYVAIWTRTAETDVERILAFDERYLSHLGLDTTWVLETHEATVPKKKYITEALYLELMDDLEPSTGKTLFIENGRLHWHLPTEGIEADIAIVEAEDADYEGLWPLMSRNPPQRSKDAADLATRVIARNDRGQTASASDETALERHDAAGLRHEKLVEEANASPERLASIAGTTLATYKAERITREGEIGPLTAEQVLMIPPGSLINCTDHAWGLADSTQRVAAVNIRYIHPDKFMLGLELGYPVRMRHRPPKTTPPPRSLASPPVQLPPVGGLCAFDFDDALGGFTEFEANGADVSGSPAGMSIFMPANVSTAAAGGATIDATLTSPMEMVAHIDVPLGIQTSLAFLFTEVGVDSVFVALTANDGGFIGIGAGATGGSEYVVSDIPTGSTVWLKVGYDGGRIRGIVWLDGEDIATATAVEDFPSPIDPDRIEINGANNLIADGCIDVTWLTTLQLTDGGPCDPYADAFVDQYYGPANATNAAFDEPAVGDGSSTEFGFPYPWVPGTLTVLVETGVGTGIFQAWDIASSDPDTRLFVLVNAPATDVRIRVVALLADFPPDEGGGGGGG